MDNETNLEQSMEIPAPKQVSQKQYEHLKRAREIKSKKIEIKQKNKQFILEQLNNIHSQIGLVGTQMNSLITKFDSHVESGGIKRKRDETEEEKKTIEPPVKLEEKKVDEQGENNSDGEGEWNWYMVSAAKCVGGLLAMASLYGYKKIMQNNELPSEYLYKNIS